MAYGGILGQTTSGSTTNTPITVYHTWLRTTPLDGDGGSWDNRSVSIPSAVANNLSNYDVYITGFVCSQRNSLSGMSTIFNPTTSTNLQFYADDSNGYIEYDFVTLTGTTWTLNIYPWVNKSSLTATSANPIQFGIIINFVPKS